MSDYIKLYRSLLDWEWYKKTNTKVLFLHMLLKANWKDGKFEGEIIPRGSFVTSLAKLSEETGLTTREVRTAILHLEKSEEVTSKRHAKYSVFTIKNYELYQVSDKQATSKRQTIEEKKEGKKERNNNIYILCKREAAEQLFETLWDMYPNKKGKDRITEKDKQKIYEIGLDKMVLGIERYKRYIEANQEWYKPKNGSTFFKGGYVDYISEDYKEPKKQTKQCGFNNFQQNDYDFESLEKELLSN